MIRLKPTRILLLGAVLAWLASWFAPTIALPDCAAPGGQLNNWLSAMSANCSGADVFRMVIRLLWTNPSVDGWREGIEFVVYIASALTNLLFVLAVTALLLGWNRWLPRLQWSVLVAAALNTYWFFAVSGLKCGYYLWAAAFFLLFGAMARRSVP